MFLNIPLKFHIWKIAAIGLGIIVSILIIHIMHFLNITFYPIPESANLSDPDSYSEFIRTEPVFLAGFLLSTLTGSFSGGAVARLTNSSLSVFTAGWVGFVLMLLEIFNLMAVDYPVWFWILQVAFYIPAAWAGAGFVKLNQQNLRGYS